MKLGQLRAAIRATKGNPNIQTSLYEGGPVMTFALQKTGLLGELERAYPGGKGVETSLAFDERTAMLVPDAMGDVVPVSHVAADPVETAPAALTDEADMLLHTVDLLLDMPPTTALRHAETSLDDLLV